MICEKFVCTFERAKGKKCVQTVSRLKFCLFSFFAVINHYLIFIQRDVVWGSFAVV
jgi:hypothetical protein